MPVLEGIRWTIDTVTSIYEKLCSGYVEELYPEIFEYISVNEICSWQENEVIGNDLSN